jgi:hypothetical protein
MSEEERDEQFYRDTERLTSSRRLCGRRLLSTRVRSFIDFAISYMTKELEGRSATLAGHICATEPAATRSSAQPRRAKISQT